MLRLSVLVLYLAIFGAAEVVRPWSTGTAPDGPATVAASSHGGHTVTVRGKARDMLAPAALTPASWSLARPAIQGTVTPGRHDGQLLTAPVDHRLPARSPPAR